MSLYNKENLEINLKLQKILNYSKTDAKKQELHKVENNIFTMLLELGKLIIEDYLIDKGTGKLDSVNDSKGEKLPFHSVKNRKYLSIFGDLTIKRAYFWKQNSTGIFPLDSDLNLPVHHHSYLLDGWIQHRITEEPYQQAIDSIADLLNLKITKKTVQDITFDASKEVESYYRQKTEFKDEGTYLIAEADCKGVIMVPKERPETKPKEEFVRRAKGVSKIGIRKDAVVTSDFSIEPAPRTPKEVLEGLMLINSDKKNEEKIIRSNKSRTPKNKQVAATMFGKEQAFKDLADRIHARDIEGKKPIFILIDGAISLKQGIQKEFERRGWKHRVEGICLDIVHATEYLWDASTALYGEKSSERVSWVKKNLLQILNSKVNSVIEEIEEKLQEKKVNKFIKRRLNRTLTYFKNHIDMMDYKKYLKKGLPIASGAIEGACNSLVKDRTDRSGMQWTKKGAQGVIGLRSVQCNHDWDNYWEYHIKKQSEKLYGAFSELAA